LADSFEPNTPGYTLTLISHLDELQHFTHT